MRPKNFGHFDSIRPDAMQDRHQGGVPFMLGKITRLLLWYYHPCCYRPVALGKKPTRMLKIETSLYRNSNIFKTGEPTWV